MVSPMKKYECPDCGKKEVLYKRKFANCLACGHKFDVKQYSKLDMHYGKHMPKKKLEFIPTESLDNPTNKTSFIIPDDDLMQKIIPPTHVIKQHFESRVSAALRSIPSLWYMKIQVNPMAHHPTLADFLILTNHHNIALECKELNIGLNESIPYSRFSQLERMKIFKGALARNESYMGILLWKGEVQEIYIVPVSVIDAHVSSSKKKSINVSEIQSNFVNYKVPFNNLESYIKKYWCD